MKKLFLLLVIFFLFSFQFIAGEAASKGVSYFQPPTSFTKKSILEKLNKIVVQVLEVEPIKVKLTSKLVEDLEADDLDTVELFMEIEKSFKLLIEDEDATKMLTVGNIYNYLLIHLKPRS